jgi:hypothetical protein
MLPMQVKRWFAKSTLQAARAGTVGDGGNPARAVLGVVQAGLKAARTSGNRIDRQRKMLGDETNYLAEGMNRHDYNTNASP